VGGRCARFALLSVAEATHCCFLHLNEKLMNWSTTSM
jgi:hypothetical protein